jgi:hypothetical protein
MKHNNYTLMFVLAAACSTAHAQDAFRNLAFVEATEGLATTAPSISADVFSQPTDTSANLATTLTSSSIKDNENTVVARTLFGGGGDKVSRPEYEGRTTRSAPAPAPSAKGGMEEPVAYDEGDSASDLKFQLDAAYTNRYFYHGLDQVENAGDGDSSGVMMLGVSATWNGFFFGYKYALAMDETTGFRGASVTEEYSENIFEAGYTVGVLPKGWLDLTASYQYIIFGDDAFWGNDAQGRFMLKAEMNRYQWFRPSVAYYKFEGIGENAPGNGAVLDGEQLVFQIRGGGQIYESGPVGVGFSYYVLAGMDNEYNNGGNDFGSVNYYQAGISFPISYQNLTVSPNLHWFEANDQGTDYNEMWAGVQATYTF